MAKWRNECKSPLFQANLQLSSCAGTVLIGCVMKQGFEFVLYWVSGIDCM